MEKIINIILQIKTYMGSGSQHLALLGLEVEEKV